MKDKIERAIRDIVDFPKPGIVFKDITPVLQDPVLFKAVVDDIVSRWRQEEIDTVAAIDARGFILGGAVAYLLGAGFVPIRKAGKLPWETVSEEYSLEYGLGVVEIHADAVSDGSRVLLVDDLLATGGTARAGINLLEKCGAEIAGVEFLIELCFLQGRKMLPGYQVNSLVKVEA